MLHALESVSEFINNNVHNYNVISPHLDSSLDSVIIIIIIQSKNVRGQ